ncbi:hypothetical protein SAMN04487831_11267 [Pseudobutyrivibrio sp. UC1225]|uniref:hypothetical protein n=1 Tax=Pseudobutyrivibrio sp. UC1225 TaxID=1798185 RepID=UPI0008E77D21|nr:hypothetical protein [Pseudobutyrivibrio sp. UC1225]SFO21958.1 hypothetical protein SAMN04487831_11267 [Pseudobutyrivibrio sp. UC1225]
MAKFSLMLNKYKVPCFGAVIQWFITIMLHIDKHIFVYESRTYLTYIIRILYLLFLLIVWCYCYFFINKLLADDELYKRGAIIFSIYFIIVMGMLLVLWPGTWSWDDIIMLRSILGYTTVYPWQHFLTGIYQDVLLQLIPHPGGIILLQNIFISVCVAFCIVKLEKCCCLRPIKNVYIDIIVKLIPFVTPPVLLYQFSGYRMGFYVYLELVMLVILISAQKEIEEWTWIYCFFFALITSIVACWRTESILYLIFAPFFIMFINTNVLPLKKKIICVTIILITSISINKVQSLCLGNDNYNIMAMMGPYAAVVLSADEEDDEELEILNKVIDVDAINMNSDLSGEALYWSVRAYRDQYTKTEFNNSIKAFIKLFFKYPKPVLEERWKLFLKATGMTGETWGINDYSISLFDEKDEINAENREFLENKGYVPIDVRCRKILINILSCKTIYGSQIKLLRILVWNAWIPIIILLFSWVSFLKQKQYYYVLLSSAVIIRIPIVYFTEPAGWIMYLLSFYFLGYVLLIYKILIRWGKNYE